MQITTVNKLVRCERAWMGEKEPRVPLFPSSSLARVFLIPGHPSGLVPSLFFPSFFAVPKFHDPGVPCMRGISVNKAPRSPSQKLATLALSLSVPVPCPSLAALLSHALPLSSFEGLWTEKFSRIRLSFALGGRVGVQKRPLFSPSLLDCVPGESLAGFISRAAV